MLRITYIAPLVGLHAFVAIEAATEELATIVVPGFIQAIGDARIAATITPVPRALFIIVLTVAGAISDPHIDASCVRVHDILVKDLLLDEFTHVVPVVDKGSLGESFVGEDLGGGTPCVAEGQTLLYEDGQESQCF